MWERWVWGGVLNLVDFVEGLMGIEFVLFVWEVEVLLLNYSFEFV